MSEIKLHPRYPNSRTEDIVDAHMRGFAAGYEFAEDEIKELREACAELYPYVGDTCPDTCKYREECESESNRGTDGFPLMCVAYNELFEKLRNLGVEVAQ